MPELFTVHDAKDGCCQEAALGLPFYAPCNKPAVAIVGWKGRTEPPLRMCKACTDHNVKKRSGVVIETLEEEDNGSANCNAPRGR